MFKKGGQEVLSEMDESNYVKERVKNGVYNDILDFSNRMTEGLFGKAHFEYLSLSGCFDSICPNRKKDIFSADVLANCANSSSLDIQAKQENIFSKNTKLSEIWKLSSVEEWTDKEKLEKEIMQKRKELESGFRELKFIKDEMAKSSSNEGSDKIVDAASAVVASMNQKLQTTITELNAVKQALEKERAQRNKSA